MGSRDPGPGDPVHPVARGASGTDLVIRTAVLSLSYTLLVAFALVNVRMPGMFLVVIGLACNFAVIAVNGGMPASAEALIDSGQEDVLAYLQEEATPRSTICSRTKTS